MNYVNSKFININSHLLFIYKREFKIEAYNLQAINWNGGDIKTLLECFWIKTIFPYRLYSL